MKTLEPILFLSDARGIYIPRDFATGIDRSRVTGIDPADLDYLADGPDGEHYWDTWADVCARAVVTDRDGVRYSVYQDGDCWLLPEGMTVDDCGTFVWGADEVQS